MAKKKTKGSAGGGQPPRADRIDRMVEVQQRSVTRCAKFFGDVSTMAVQGAYNPADWTNKYVAMLKDLAIDLGDMTRILFKD